ncbi:MAG: sporulation protein YqfD [Oscillospiraceae bacterium]|nr:sporulation protein YqfD [Oscillospiraceae bacterium]
MTALELALRGYVEVELHSAAPERCLNRLADWEVPFWDTTPLDEFTVRLFVFFRDLKRLRHEAERAQAEVRVVREAPGVWFFLTWLRRPFLLAGLALAIFAVLRFPCYVWTVSVSGNETIPTSEILRAVDTLGVCFGTKTDSIHSQDIKNRLLNLVDGLQWAAVNCSGGCCQVLVKEREKAPTLLDRQQAADVVAARDGTIIQMSVLEGQTLCQVGDTVTEGQKLVSGVNDFVVNLQTARAQAEIYALTWRNLEVKTPAVCEVPAERGQKSVARYLQIGRLRIKISGSSSISGVTCDKIIEREKLTLPGGITFPVTLITETCRETVTEERPVTEQEATVILEGYGANTVERSMVAGQILSQKKSVVSASGCYILQCIYSCQEMIAREQEIQLYGSE